MPDDEPVAQKSPPRSGPEVVAPTTRVNGNYSGPLTAASTTREFDARIVGNSDRRSSL